MVFLVQIAAIATIAPSRVVSTRLVAASRRPRRIDVAPPTLAREPSSVSVSKNGTTKTKAANGWDHGQRRRALVESLIREIVTGALRPGEHLVTQGLARRYGVSHTPVREALIMLAGMGLVDSEPNRGAIVRRVTPREIRQIRHVRVALERAAVRLACRRIPRDRLERFRDEFQAIARVNLDDENSTETLARARALDSELHDLIATGSGNVFLINELERLNILFRAFRDEAWTRSQDRRDFHRLASEASEHLDIVEALLAGDRRAAGRAMTRHITSGMKYWGRAIPEGASRPTDPFEEEEPK